MPPRSLGGGRRTHMRLSTYSNQLVALMMLAKKAQGRVTPDSNQKDRTDDTR